MFSLPLPAILGLGPTEFVVIITILAIPVALVIVVAGLYFRHQQEKLWHETARIALEKGQPMPPMRDEKEARPGSRDAAQDFRAGLVLVGVGVGLYFFLGFGFAALVGSIGVALLVYSACVALFAKKNSPQDPPSRS